ncbi:hypothetical protein DW712_17105 [Bacteroides intestinalis]|uniref:Uncharacterized protein n=1 Tax=Bacteroides intestinalis TaxID=329854 RepID=A0A414L5E5_9BACE|nr:hypothetical protein DW712_17105 [Bacteroides intestinalis]
MFYDKNFNTNQTTNREAFDFPLLLLQLYNKPYRVPTLVDRLVSLGQQADQPTSTGLLTKVNTQLFLRVNKMFISPEQNNDLYRTN